MALLVSSTALASTTPVAVAAQGSSSSSPLGHRSSSFSFLPRQDVRSLRVAATSSSSPLPHPTASDEPQEPSAATGSSRGHRAPPPPPEWAEVKRQVRDAEIEALDGVSIRRRPPSGHVAHMAMGAFEFRIDGEDANPRNILEEIVWHKDVEVAGMKERTPLGTLAGVVARGGLPPARDFVGALRRRESETGVPALIAEVKKASPSRGVIQADFDPVRIAKAYERAGAACLSVLTDAKFFQGSFENLQLIRAAGVSCPLLCKEFIVDAWQIYKARVSGADAVLLIAAVLPDKDLRYLTKIAKRLGMAALIEVHTEREMDRVLRLEEAELIGINNRDLETFAVNIGNTQQLLAGVRGEEIRERRILVVGESGLFTPTDIAFVQNAGCNAVLVGESLVRTADPSSAIAALFGRSIASDTCA